MWGKFVIIAAMLAAQTTSVAALQPGNFVFDNGAKGGIRTVEASSCADTRYLCLQKVGRWSIRYSSHWQQCQITFNQCMRR